MLGAEDSEASQPPADYVDFYRVELNPPPELALRCRKLLSEEERIRADRYVTADLTRRSVVCRGVLRQILGSVLAVPPAELRFRAGPHGKPSLVDEPSSVVEFNVSHTEDLAVIAVARRRVIGVDVEAVDRRVSRDELAARFFSQAECQAYFALPEAHRPAAFYRIWTCKEAYLKATGAGLSFPLGKFSVSVAPFEPPGLLAVEGAPDEVERWSFVAPPVGPGYAAALAVEGHGWTLRCRDWDHCAGTGISCDRK